ncbi:MAG: hypothetical protein QM731_14855 [Chitinophagaceae bacterium]
MEFLRDRGTMRNLVYYMHSIIILKRTTMFSRLMALVVLLAGLPLLAGAQRITYAETEREDSRRTNFEIVGKIGGNILVFKNNNSNNAISVYDNDMKLLNRQKLDYMDERWINVDFVPYSDFCWMIYQFQRRGIVYCMAVKLDGNAKRLTDPIELDTTRIGSSTGNKIYTTVFSDDKQKIMVFKINNRNPRSFVFTTLLFDAELKLQSKHRMNMPMEERNDYFTDFLLDNEGDLVFGKFVRKGNDYITHIQLITKKWDQEQFIVHDLRNEDRILDEIKLKIDNTNRRYLFTAFYYTQKRGSVEGLYTVVWDKGQDNVLREMVYQFNDDLRRQAKGQDASLKMAFDDYFISNMIIRKDGGFILIAESLYTTSRAGGFNRWDNMYGNNPWASPMDYYYWSPYYSPYGSYWNRRYGNQGTRYNAENIMVLSFDKSNAVEWVQVLPKTQYDDDGEGLISHQVMITGGELHFIYNQYERRTLLLNEQTIDGLGKITRHPTLKNLDKDIDFMPRYGKQISSNSMIVPCQTRNYITFAKIDF